MSLDGPRIPAEAVGVFGSFAGGDVHEVILRSPGGIEVSVLTYGAIVRDFSVRMDDGHRLGMVLGYTDLDSYLSDPNYFGAIVGRYANRIANGRFSIAGRSYHLDRNEQGRTTLHGGAEGFSRRVWTVEQLTATSVTLRLVSPDGDQGFPGEVTATCRYEVSDQDGLLVDLSAQSTMPTPFSLAQHSYFTLGRADVRDLHLAVHASHYTPVDQQLIPTGEIAPVAGTPFDFRTARPVGSVAGGLDHNFVLHRSSVAEERVAAQVENRDLGLSLIVTTTQPGLQVYDGRMIASRDIGKVGTPYAGLCLETQAYPDSPNQPTFPSCILHPGRVDRHRTFYRFQITPGKG